MGKSKVVILTALVTLAAACSGSQGAQGPQGPAGADGANGLSAGTIAGTVTSTDAVSGQTAPVPNVNVTLTPVVGVSTSTGANGQYTLANVPIGIYTVTFSGTGIATTTVSNVTVVAGATATVNATAAYSPITISLNTPTNVGFSSAAAVNATVGGATGPLTYTWSLTKPAGLSSTAAVPALSPSGTVATFTTNAFSDYNFHQLPASVSGTGNGGVQLAGTSLIIPNRATLLGITPGAESAGFNYTVTLTVNDGTYTQTASTSVYPIGTSPGTPYNAANVTLIANDVTTLFNWSLTYSATDPTVASGTTPAGVVVENATGKNPVFTTNAQGFWALTNGVAGGATLKFRTQDYVGLGSLPSTYTTCGACHPAGSAPGGISPPAGETDTLSPDVAWGKWSQSAHGNYYWDPTGVWYSATGSPPAAIAMQSLTINGASGFPTVGTISVPTIPGALTLFAQGVDGVIGSHYGTSCIECHTDGYKNPESLPNLGNGGFSDVAAAEGWTFPNDSTINYNRYNSVPANLQNMAGIQCENCHGPIGMHPAEAAATKPLPVWNATACAVCHDEAPTHASVLLWSQSKHANYQVAINEGGSGSSCVRCHTAQGYADYVTNGIDNNNGTDYFPIATVATSTAEGAMPQTCQACHDPHSTTLRVNPASTFTTPAGFVVASAGKGSTCFVCHNTRDFARGDAVQPCPGFQYSTSAASPAPAPLCTPVTTITTSSGSFIGLNIGTPHDGRQGDIMAGANGYFVNGAPSKHMAVTDTCVGCHMKLNTATVTLSGSNTNHTFKADGTICANCHSSATNLTQLEGQFTVAYNNVVAALPNFFQNALVSNAGGTSASPSYYVTTTTGTGCSAGCVVNVTEWPNAIAFTGHGGVTLSLTFPSAVAYSNSAGTALSATTLSVALTGVSPTGTATSSGVAGTLGTPLFTPGGVFARVAWNSMLVSSITANLPAGCTADTSSACTPVANPAALVVHNPTFVFDVLSGTLAALQNPAALVTGNGSCGEYSCTVSW